MLPDVTLYSGICIDRQNGCPAGSSSTRQRSGAGCSGARLAPSRTALASAWSRSSTARSRCICFGMPTLGPRWCLVALHVYSGQPGPASLHRDEGVAGKGNLPTKKPSPKGSEGHGLSTVERDRSQASNSHQPTLAVIKCRFPRAPLDHRITSTCATSTESTRRRRSSRQSGP